MEKLEHRTHEYVKLEKVYNEAKSQIDELLDKFADLRFESQSEIARYEQQLVDERYKNEVKLAEFMKKVDEELQRF